MGHLARALSPLCERLEVVAPHPAPPRVAEDGNLPFRVHRIAFHSSWLVLPLLARLPSIVRSCGATHVLYAQWFPALAGRRLPSSVRQASIVHGRELLNHPLGRAGLALAGPTLARLDAVIPNSRRTAELLPAAVPRDRVHVVHPGVDGALFAPLSEARREAFRERLGIAPGTPVVTCLTRLVPRKGVDTLVEAAAILREHRPDVQVLVGGGGPDRPRLEDKIRQLGLGGTVRLLGRIDDDDLPAFLSSGVFTLLSREETRDVEGYGMVLAEAQSCGAPVVAARSGGMPEAVGPGAGRIVAPDSPAEAASALLELMDPQVRDACGRAGVLHAAGLDWPSRARAILAILEPPPDLTPCVQPTESAPPDLRPRSRMPSQRPGCIPDGGVRFGTPTEGCGRPGAMTAPRDRPQRFTLTYW